MKMYWGWRYSATHSLTIVLGGEWSASHPHHFTCRERAPSTHWMGGWMGPRVGMDMMEKRKIPSPPLGIEPPNSNHPAHSQSLK